MDSIDLEILRALQADAHETRSRLGERVGLSPAAVHGRIRKLERAGVIRGYAATIDPEAVGVDLLAFVRVFIDHPSYERAFEAVVAELDAIQECHWVTGSASALLKVRVADRRALQATIERINATQGVRQTETTVVLSTSKETARIPIVLEDDDRSAP